MRGAAGRYRTRSSVIQQSSRVRIPGKSACASCHHLSMFNGTGTFTGFDIDSCNVLFSKWLTSLKCNDYQTLVEVSLLCHPGSKAISSCSFGIATYHYIILLLSATTALSASVLVSFPSWLASMVITHHRRSVTERDCLYHLHRCLS